MPVWASQQGTAAVGFGRQHGLDHVDRLDPALACNTTRRMGVAGKQPRHQMREIAAALLVFLLVAPTCHFALATYPGDCSATAHALVPHLTLAEKVALLSTNSPAVPRLHIPAFNFWSEGIHGYKVPSPPGATIFPSPLAMGATFNPALLKQLATAVSDEARAYHNAALAQGLPPRALHMFGPNINLLRDPRWGRANEVYSEDPVHMGKMARAFVQGLQGEYTPHKLKVGATCKHFAGYSLEAASGYTRHNYDARTSKRDLAESYLPAFQACVESGASAVMCSYNSLNGQPTCASEFLLNQTLRQQWNFMGFVVSDCNAVSDIFHHHKTVKSLPQAFASSVNAGCDLNCDDAWAMLQSAVRQGLVQESALDAAVARVLLARCRLGILQQTPVSCQKDISSANSSDSVGAGFDGVHGTSLAHHGQVRIRPGPFPHLSKQQGTTPWDNLTMEVVGSTAHKALAREAAAQSIVLLVNKEDEEGLTLLPLNEAAVKSVAILGPLADSQEHLLGSYYGAAAGNIPTPLSALRDRLGSERVSCYPILDSVTDTPTADGLMWATQIAAAADITIVVVGSSGVDYRKQDSKAGGARSGMSTPVVESEGLDRRSLRLSGQQEDLVLAAARGSKRVIVVLIHGGPLDVSVPMAASGVRAVLTAWYPGQGAEAIVDVLFGDVPPSGRLPSTWYFENYTSQSDILDMSMRTWPGRTHRYVQVPVLFPFGHGLSYPASLFKYRGLHLSLCSAVGADSEASGHSQTNSDSSASRTLQQLMPQHRTSHRSFWQDAAFQVADFGHSRHAQLKKPSHVGTPAVGAPLHVKGPDFCVRLTCTLQHSGVRDAQHVVMLLGSRDPAGMQSADFPPRSTLLGFKRIMLGAGRTTESTFLVHAPQLMHADADGQMILAKGMVQLTVGPLHAALYMQP